MLAAAVVLFLLMVAQPVAAQTPAALVTPATQEHHVGKVILMQLVTPDLTAARQFYGALFGWTFRDLKLGPDNYSEAMLDGQLVAGLVHRPQSANARQQSSWLTFLACRDVDATSKLAVANGARVLRAPHTIPNRGREAVLADPQGAVFALLASSSGDPPDEFAAPGEWIWSSLATRNPDADAGFYQILFNYEVFELPESDDGGHLLFAADDYARASAHPLPAGHPDAHPRWLNYIHVNDVDAMSVKLQALGGRVLVEPHPDRHGGKLAIVADPLGAPFGLLEWPDVPGQEQPQ